MRIATAETWYETTPLEDGVTHIHEPFHQSLLIVAYIWHVRGRDRDMLVDSGMGVVSLKEQVSLGGRTCLAWRWRATPISITSAAITNSPSALVHRDEADSDGGGPLDASTLADPYVSGRNLHPASASALSARPAMPSRRPGRPGLLERRRHWSTSATGWFEVIHTPGHSPGEIMLWEADERHSLLRRHGLRWAADRRRLSFRRACTYVASMKRIARSACARGPRRPLSRVSTDRAIAS